MDWHGPVAERTREFVDGLGSGVICAIAYGSGVLQQTGYDPSESRTVDLILGVSNGPTWHEEILQTKANHYSHLGKFFGGNIIGKIQNYGGGRLYYNAGVKIKGVSLKYGVISVKNLLDDLCNWTNFYMAGRFQKPVCIFFR